MLVLLVLSWLLWSSFVVVVVAAAAATGAAAAAGVVVVVVVVAAAVTSVSSVYRLKPKPHAEPTMYGMPPCLVHDSKVD